MERLVRNRPSCGETRRPSRPRIGGFTLTELLVTMAIMALLLALLLPALSGALGGAGQAQRQSLFRDAARAMLEYAQDHQGSFPKVTNLAEADQQVRQALEPYLDKKLLRGLPPMGWRYTVKPKFSLNFVKLDQIRNPGCKPIGGEPFSGRRDTGKVLVIFADGHVGRMTQEELSKALTLPLIEEKGTGGGVPFDVNEVECSQ